MGDGRRHPQPGDLIEIKRSLVYRHWALYLGDGYVIHVTDVGAKDIFMSVGFSSHLTGTAKMKKELLKDAVGNNDWNVNNKYDRSHTPLPVEKIIQNAENFVDMEFQYSPMRNNCEHFVTLLRYDDKFSEQV
ncbi:HRSL1 enzyme, partial [Irena cyanogastra]|nr:HRSL1 enzyme [Irena cyanogastra]